MLVSNMNLFPICRAIPGIPSDYYVDRQYNVYSTRAGKHPLLMQGSRAGGDRYYTFAGSGTRSSKALRQAISTVHGDFIRETEPTQHQMSIFPSQTGNKVAQAVTGNMTKSSSTHYQTADAAIQGRGVIIGSVDEQGFISISAKPAVHVTGESARKEAERLAQANPGKRFVRLQIIDAVQVAGVRWM